MSKSRVGVAGTIATNSLISASGLNAMAGGEIGRDILTADSTGTTGVETVCTVTTDVGDGSRQILVKGCVCVQPNIEGGCQAALYMDGFQIQRKNVESCPAAEDQSWGLFVSFAPFGGSHTFTLVTGVSGQGTVQGGFPQIVTCKANGATGTNGVTELIVLDVGSAY